MAKKINQPAGKTAKKTAGKIAEEPVKKLVKKDSPAGNLKNASQTDKVNAYMDKLDHPFKAEAQAVREIIKNVNSQITEDWKWNAPSFSYKGYMVTFNLWANKHVHLVFHNGAILRNTSGLLEGDYVDRRMVYFSNMEDIKSKKTVLEEIIKEWIKLMDK